MLNFLELIALSFLLLPLLIGSINRKRSARDENEENQGSILFNRAREDTKNSFILLVEVNINDYSLSFRTV